MQGVVLVATIDAVLIGAGLLALGVPVAMPLIVLTFIAAFFPIVGAFAAGAAAVLVALVANGLPTALVILGIIVLVQQLEGNVFYPIVVGRKLRCTRSGSCSRSPPVACSRAWRARSWRCRSSRSPERSSVHARAPRGAAGDRGASPAVGGSLRGGDQAARLQREHAWR